MRKYRKGIKQPPVKSLSWDEWLLIIIALLMFISGFIRI